MWLMRERKIALRKDLRVSDCLSERDEKGVFFCVLRERERERRGIDVGKVCVCVCVCVILVFSSSSRPRPTFPSHHLLRWE